MSVAISEAFNSIKNVKSTKVESVKMKESTDEFGPAFLNNFLKAFGDYYEFLYDNATDECCDTVTSLCSYLCEQALKKDAKLKRLLNVATEQRGDFFTSDRELAAFFLVAVTQISIKTL